MGIRARLLLAFTPLLAALIVLAVVTPLASWQAAALIERQEQSTADLLRSQDLALAIFLEHDAAGHIAEGEVAPDSVRYRAARAQAAALVDAEAAREDASTDIERDLASQYGELARLHDEVVAAAATGDMAGAAALFERPAVDQTLDAILSLSQEARDANRADVSALIATAQESAGRAVLLVGAALVGGLILAAGLTWLLIRQIVRPLDSLAADAERYATGDLAGTLSPAGAITQLRRLRDAFQHLIDANLARQRRIQAVVDELEQRVAREGQLRATVQALSLPVVPLADDTLLLPIVGHLDEARSAELNRALLEAIRQRRARVAVLDITGLAELGPATADTLRRAVDAARLLGCQVTLVGVRADQAVALSALDLHARGVAVARDIPAVLAAQRT